MKNRNKLALIYDFDKTLSPKDMQEFHLLPALGYNDPAVFWKQCDELAHKHNIDGILAYMYLLIKDNPDLSQKQLLDEGKYVQLYKGVNTWFDRINDYGKQHNVEVEHYVISSGLADIIKGTAIAKHFKRIYACNYLYDINGKVLWPSRIVNYTMKTQYLFRINKGVLLETNDEDLNSSTPESEKYISLKNMVYFGDGSTDVPSMKVVQQNGGTTIAVFGDVAYRNKADKLFDERRANFAVKADYSKGSRIEKIIQNIINSVQLTAKLEDYK